MLAEVFKRQLQSFREAGLIDLWIENYIDDRKSNSKHREPSQLHMENVVAAFHICGFMWFISFVVFILEVINGRWRRVQSAIDYLTY